MKSLRAVSAGAGHPDKRVGVGVRDVVIPTAHGGLQVFCRQNAETGACGAGRGTSCILSAVS